jgi:hypothetical protein
MPDVSTWVRRCQAGNLEAFSALFKEYQQRVTAARVIAPRLGPDSPQRAGWAAPT